MTEEEHALEDDDPKKFVVGQGGEAIKELLKRIHMEDEITRLRAELKDDPSVLKKTENIKRLRVLEAFRTKPGIKAGISPNGWCLMLFPLFRRSSDLLYRLRAEGLLVI